MKTALVAGIMALLLISGLFIGYLAGSREGPSGGEDGSENLIIQAPVWERGRFWTYSFNIPETGILTSKIAVAGDEGENYEVGVNNLMDARRHAVLNFDPMLGRIGMNGLEVYENNEPQPLFKFPLTLHSNWSFSMFGVDEFEARVVSIKQMDISEYNRTTIVKIEAEGPSGESLRYSYDTSSMWIRELTLSDGDEPSLEMDLVSHGTGYTGDLFFVRGVDLFDDEYSSSRGSPEIDLYNSFIDRGHPNWGPFDELIYFYDVETRSGTVGTLTIRDHSTRANLRRTFESNMVARSLGTLESKAGEWSVTVSFAGDSDLHIKIAGGIVYSWNV